MAINTSCVPVSAPPSPFPLPGATPNAFLYAGLRLDDATGDYVTQSRIYDAAAGRFTSRDTFAGLENKPITQNHYLYANASPTNIVDPTGYEGELAESISVSGLNAAFTHFSYSVIQFTAAHPLISLFATSVISATGIFEGVPPGDPTPLDELASWGRLLRGSLQFIKGSTRAFDLTVNGVDVITSEIDSKGVVNFSIEAVNAGVRGRNAFYAMIAHYGSNVKGILGVWTSREPGPTNKNLGVVNRLTAQGVKLEDAVRQAWTTKVSAFIGFTNIKDIKAFPENAPGNYTKIEVLFTR